MKKIFILVIICFFSSYLNAQSGFTRNISIPVTDSSLLELPWAGGMNFPMFSQIDLNNDGLPDLFGFDRGNNRVLTFINTGTGGSHCWRYEPQYADKFPQLKGWAFLYDYNCDGKPDLFTVGDTNDEIAQYKNESLGNNIAFTLVDASINFYYSGSLHTNILASSNLVPDFNDIDGDGDMDIIAQELSCPGGFAYFKNMSMEHTGRCDSLNDYIQVTDLWGNFTLRSGGFPYVAVNLFHVHCFQSPHDNSTYQVARRDDTYANIRTIDIDGDGDKDILIGDAGAINSLLVINGGTSANADMVSQDTLNPSYDVPVHIKSFAAHSFVDADNDGLTDLIVSQSEWENKSGTYFYKNQGTNAVPHYNKIENNFLQKEMIDVGESATPVLFDYDGDGIQDIVVGNRYITTSDTTAISGLALYKNTGTASAPAFQFITDDFAGLHAMNIPGQLYPAFADLDGDGDEDMILGLDDGRLMYFTNTAGPGAAATFATPVYHYMTIDVGQASTPQLFDLNNDGLSDLIIGNKNGYLKYYENTGTPTSAFFNSLPTIDTLGKIYLHTMGSSDGYSVPFAFKQNGDTRMLVSCMDGYILLYGNIAGNLADTFLVLDTVLTKTAGARYGYNLSVSGGDLNNDSLVDMLIGLNGGGFQIYYQDNLNASISSPSSQGDLYRILPNPASDFVVIKSSAPSGNAKCTLVDITGRVIMTQTLTGGYAILNVSGIASGSYMLNIISEKANVTKKITIQR